MAQQDLNWLVDRRSKIQALSLEILLLLKERKSFFAQNNLCGKVSLLSVGTAFSLWRAVFLAHPPTTWADNLENAELYLERVIRDNAITYQDDKKMQRWSFGYYVNNARFRLQAIGDLMPNDLRAAELDDPVTKASAPGLISFDAWDYCYGALTLVVKSLNEKASFRVK